MVARTTKARRPGLHNSSSLCNPIESFAALLLNRGNYAGNGYAVTLGTNLATSSNVVNTLISSGWLHQRTPAVLVKFLFFNPEEYSTRQASLTLLFHSLMAFNGGPCTTAPPQIATVELKE